MSSSSSFSSMAPTNLCGIVSVVDGTLSVSHPSYRVSTDTPNRSSLPLRPYSECSRGGPDAHAAAPPSVLDVLERVLPLVRVVHPPLALEQPDEPAAARLRRELGRLPDAVGRQGTGPGSTPRLAVIAGAPRLDRKHDESVADHRQRIACATVCKIPFEFDFWSHFPLCFPHVCATMHFVFNICRNCIAALCICINS